MAERSRRSETRLSTLQQERSKETRRKLIASALRLWTSRGFDETTVSAVCADAGVSKGTFYFYFARKEDLLLELAATTAESVSEEWRSKIETDGASTETLREVVGAIARRTSRTPPALLERIVRELFASLDHWRAVRGKRNDFRDVLEPVMRSIQERTGSSKYDPMELAEMQSVLLLQGMLTWARDGERPLDEVLWKRIDLVLEGSGNGTRPVTDDASL